MKNWLFRLLILLVTIIILLFLIELFLRLFIATPTNVVVYSERKTELAETNIFQNIMLDAHPEEGGLYIETNHGRRLNPNMNVLIKNHSLSNRTINIRTNSLGFRNPELSTVKEKKRILFLGDSITFGDWLEEEETFVRLVEKKLHKIGLTDYKTINAGVGSIGAENVLNILKETGSIVQPDIIIFNFYLNDFEQSPGIQMLNPPNLFRNSYLLQNLYKVISVFRAKVIQKQEGFVDTKTIQTWFNELNQLPSVKSDVITDIKTFNYFIKKNKTDWGLAWSKQAWDYIKPVILEMQNEANRLNAEFIMVLFPVREQVSAEFLYDYPQQKMKELTDKLNMPYLDLLPVLRKEYQRHQDINRLFYDQCHNTEEGNEIVAEIIYRHLLYLL